MLNESMVHINAPMQSDPVKNIFKTKVLPLSWVLSIPLLGVIYSELNTPSRGIHSLVTDLDRSIPFVKGFILPYVGWEFFLFLTLIYYSLKDQETYRKTLLAINIGMILSYVIYFFYQTTVPRPLLAGTDGLTQMVRFVYQYDAPFNCFPSIHTLTSYLLIRGIQGSSAKGFWNRLVIIGGAASIILSTLLVKQHVLLDVVGAMALGESLWRGLSRLKGLSWNRNALIESVRLIQPNK